MSDLRDCETSDGKLARRTVIDGLTQTQKRIDAVEYSASTVYAVRVLVVGTGDLVLSPYNGDADITITNAELVAMGINAYTLDWYGPFDSVTPGAGMSILVYCDAT